MTWNQVVLQADPTAPDLHRLEGWLDRLAERHRFAGACHHPRSSARGARYSAGSTCSTTNLVSRFSSRVFCRAYAIAPGGGTGWGNGGRAAG